MQKLKNQAGFVISQILAAIGALALLSIIAYGSYYAITKGTAQTTIKRHAGDLLSQAAYTLTTECTDPDGDGFPESPAGKPGTFVPTGGFSIPDSSGAPKTDPWGDLIGYCPWDNGSMNSSTNRINGDNPGTQSSLVFAVVSAGPNKVFDTSCADIKAGTVRGDDGVRRIMVSQVRQGVGGTVYYGDPVNNIAELNALNTSVLKDGELRLVKSENKIYRWNSATSTWTDIGSGFWAKNGDHIYNTNTGFVGIGTQNPNNRLQVVDLIDFGGTTTKIGFRAGLNATGAWNTFLGYEAGRSALGSTGYDNTGIGYLVLNSNTGGYNNTAVGTQALYDNAGGYKNTALGAYSLRSNTFGNNNTAVGDYSMYRNTTGNYNTAVGASSLFNNTSGYDNTAVGYLAIYFGAGGRNNTAVGSNALYRGSTNDCTAVGAYSLQNNSGYGNTAVGARALQNNTSGYYNTAVGSESLRSNTTGGFNTAVGEKTLQGNTSGNRNTALGTWALYFNSSGTNNVAVGERAFQSNYTGNDNVAIGASAGRLVANGNLNTQPNNSIYLGANSMSGDEASTNEIVIGAQAFGAGSNSVVLGNSSITRTYLRSNVGVGVLTYETISYPLHVNGSAAATSFITLSDKRFKHNIQSLKEDILEKVLKLDPVTFIRKDKSRGEERQYGLIAQDVEKIFPEMVDTAKDGTKYLNYQAFIPILIKTIQEQQKQIEVLKKQTENANIGQKNDKGQRLYAIISIVAAVQIFTILLFTIKNKRGTQ